MATPPNGMHVCPTRVDGSPVLFAHSVTKAMCQERQRGLYHKCFMCVHNNARGETGKNAAQALAKLSPATKVSAG
ncbi:MAG: hypothetical protein IT453_08195 [Planctomycetes bacterium]|jgi:hypothetical protein|nr:hypothetical protein [Planctomycetota bacterium]MCC6407132.1 hypothetical protein [Planctomycetota bacterium]